MPASTNYHQQGASPAAVGPVTVLETGSLKSRCGRAVTPPKALREDSSCLSQLLGLPALLGLCVCIAPVPASVPMWHSLTWPSLGLCLPFASLFYGHL